MLQTYVSRVSDVSEVCSKCFYLDVVKVYLNVAYVASISDVCCNRLLKMFHLFQTYVASV
jgi:hypothetical protein